jgi:S-adenosylmethionine hydrolase
LPISRTFEGRDRFAPAAGWLAAGVPIDALGPAVERCVPLEVPRPVTREASLDGEVLRSDRFGNLITNIDRPAFDRFLAGRAARIEAGGPVAVPFVNTYADVSLGMLCALFGSGGSLELSVNGGSAAALLSAGRGLLVRVRRAVSGQD